MLPRYREAQTNANKNPLVVVVFFGKSGEFFSVTAEFEAPLRQLFADFIEAGDAEVLAFHQIFGRPADEFGDEVDA